MKTKYLYLYRTNICYSIRFPISSLHISSHFFCPLYVIAKKALCQLVSNCAKIHVNSCKLT